MNKFIPNIYEPSDPDQEKADPADLVFNVPVDPNPKDLEKQAQKICAGFVELKIDRDLALVKMAAGNFSIFKNGNYYTFGNADPADLKKVADFLKEKIQNQKGKGERSTPSCRKRMNTMNEKKCPLNPDLKCEDCRWYLKQLNRNYKCVAAAISENTLRSFIQGLTSGQK